MNLDAINNICQIIKIILCQTKDSRMIETWSQNNTNIRWSTQEPPKQKEMEFFSLFWFRFHLSAIYHLKFLLFPLIYGRKFAYDHFVNLFFSIFMNKWASDDPFIFHLLYKCNITTVVYFNRDNIFVAISFLGNVFENKWSRGRIWYGINISLPFFFHLFSFAKRIGFLQPLLFLSAWTSRNTFYVASTNKLSPFKLWFKHFGSKFCIATFKWESANIVDECGCFDLALVCVFIVMYMTFELVLKYIFLLILTYLLMLFT